MKGFCADPLCPCSMESHFTLSSHSKLAKGRVQLFFLAVAYAWSPQEPLGAVYGKGTKLLATNGERLQATIPICTHSFP